MFIQEHLLLEKITLSFSPNTPAHASVLQRNHCVCLCVFPRVSPGAETGGAVLCLVSTGGRWTVRPAAARRLWRWEI